MDMKRPKRPGTNGRGANGEAKTHILLERIVKELTSMRREMGDMRGELTARIDATNTRLDHLVDILAPKIKKLEDRVTVLETGRTA